MTVKCLDSIDKDVLVDLYKYYNHSVTDLANLFQVSRRTVYRVLAENGITFEPKKAVSKLTTTQPQQSTVAKWGQKLISFVTLGRFSASAT